MDEKKTVKSGETEKSAASLPSTGTVLGCGICNCDSMMYCGPSGSYTEMYTMEKQNKKDGDD